MKFNLHFKINRMLLDFTYLVRDNCNIQFFKLFIVVYLIHLPCMYSVYFIIYLFELFKMCESTYAMLTNRVQLIIIYQVRHIIMFTYISIRFFLNFIIF